MNVNRIIEVQAGDAVHSFQEFLKQWWQMYPPDALLAPVETDDRRSTQLGLISSPEELPAVNPFAPIMTENGTLNIWRYLQKHPGRRIVLILRPCELRTYIELCKRNRMPVFSDTVTLMGVDCLGTFTQGEFQQLVTAQGMQAVTETMLKNAAEGGLQALRIRPACQMCTSPSPQGADVIIGTIGVDTRRYLLLIARNEAIDQRLHFGQVTAHLATEYQVSHREFLAGAIADTRTGIRRKMIEETEPNSRFNDLGCLLALFANCTLCGKCLQACPLYNGKSAVLAGRKPAGRAGELPLKALVELSHWLASCSGCGMCEEACPQKVPLSLLISGLSQRIQREIHYKAGNPAVQLPWTG